MTMYGVVPPVKASSQEVGTVLLMFGNIPGVGFELLYVVLLHIIFFVVAFVRALKTMVLRMYMVVSIGPPFVTSTLIDKLIEWSIGRLLL